MRDEILKKVGGELAGLRKNAGHTTRSLADVSGVDFSSIGRIERGEYNASVLVLSKILDALDYEIAFVVKKK